MRGQIPVRLRVNRGAPLHATLIPRGDGRHRIFLNQEARGGARTGRFAVELRVEAREREVLVPEDLEAALREEGVLGAWEALPPGKREHILRWIDEAVHEATRAKRIGRAVAEALARYEKIVDKTL